MVVYTAGSIMHASYLFIIFLVFMVLLRSSGGRFYVLCFFGGPEPLNYFPHRTLLSVNISLTKRLLFKRRSLC